MQQGIVLPAPAPAIGSYAPVIQSGKFLFLSGVLSKTAQGEVFSGRGGQDSLERGAQAARLAALNALALLRNYLDNLDRIEKIIRLVGYVQSEPSFQDQSKVLNGASDLLISLFGEKGRHARSAVGVAGLPLGAFVEIEMTVEI
ncbi:MAG: RidA family protein [Candidatus Omnitrophica bacterium]|nr:RidA family protein [Candidatus Omnitrophota bacterium]